MFKLSDEITKKNLSYILNNPWEFTHYEWKLHNERNKKNALVYLIKRAELTRNGGYSKIWRTSNNLPLAILGAYKVNDSKLEGFFVASKHMEEDDHALKVTFNMRQVLKEESNKYKGYTFGLYSESKKIDNQMSWLRFLGFKYVPDGNSGSIRYFEYISRV